MRYADSSTLAGSARGLTTHHEPPIRAGPAGEQRIEMGH